MITSGKTNLEFGQFVETQCQLINDINIDISDQYIVFNNKQTGQKYFRLRINNNKLQYSINLGGDLYGDFEDLIPLQSGIGSIQDRIQNTLISQKILTDLNDIKIISNGQIISQIDSISGNAIRQQSGNFSFQVNGDNSSSNNFEIKGNRDSNGNLNQTVLSLKQRDFTSINESSMVIIQMGVENDVGASIDFGTGKFVNNPNDIQSASFIQCLNPQTQVLALSSGQALVNNTIILYSDNNDLLHPLQTQFNRKVGYDPNNIPPITEATQFISKDHVSSNYYPNTTPLNQITIPDNDLSMNNHKIINLADPSQPQDAVTLNYLHYLKLRCGTVDIGDFGLTGTISIPVTGDIISAQKLDAFANKDSFIDIVFANNGSIPLGFVQYISNISDSSANQIQPPIILQTTNTTMRILLEKKNASAVNAKLNIMLITQ